MLTRFKYCISKCLIIFSVVITIIHSNLVEIQHKYVLFTAPTFPPDQRVTLQARVATLQMFMHKQQFYPTLHTNVKKSEIIIIHPYFNVKSLPVLFPEVVLQTGGCRCSL